MTLEETFEECKREGIELGLELKVRMGIRNFPSHELANKIDKNLIPILKHLVKKIEYYEHKDEEIFNVLIDFDFEHSSIFHSSYRGETLEGKKELKEKYQEAMYGK